MELEELLKQIQELDKIAMEQSVTRWNSIAKPIGSLGKLEHIITQITGIKRDAKDLNLEKKALVIFCADHGVVKEGVTQTGAYVTRIVSENFAKGNSTVNTMAKVANVDVYPIDMGMDVEPYPNKELRTTQVIDRKINRGTKNIAKESAMTIKQCRAAIIAGVQVVRDLKEMGYGLIATGEMGIGNTTPTSALAAVFLNQSAKQVTGKGAGLSKDKYEHKISVIEGIIKRYYDREDQATILDTLADIGGYEIAGMVGAFLGGAIYGIPILIDGVISCVAALAAYQIEPKVKKYMIATHESREPASRLLLQALDMEPILQGDMRLGEGTGAIAAIPVITMAAAVYEEMGTFLDHAIEKYHNYDEGE